MSTTNTESNGLLSPERVAEIAARIQKNYAYYSEEERRAEVDAEGDFVLDAADLLADRLAFRQQVATELAELLTAPNNHEGWRGRDYWQGVNDTTARIQQALSRLGIDLPIPISK